MLAGFRGFPRASRAGDVGPRLLSTASLPAGRWRSTWSRQWAWARSVSCASERSDGGLGATRTLIKADRLQDVKNDRIVLRLTDRGEVTSAVRLTATVMERSPGESGLLFLRPSGVGGSSPTPSRLALDDEDDLFLVRIDIGRRHQSSGMIPIRSPQRPRYPESSATRYPQGPYHPRSS